MGTLTDIYARDSSWISAQKRGRIDGKKIITNQSGDLELKPASEDFPTILKSVLDPGIRRKYQYPGTEEIKKQGEIKYLEYKKGKK
jgi:hypothetical protein